jgi:hypothetical protein
VDAASPFDRWPMARKSRAFGWIHPDPEVGVAVKLWAKQVVAMLYAVPDEHWTSIVDCRAPESRRLILGIRGWTVCSRWSKGLG